MVDERLIQKYEAEAKQNNRESWYMAYIMDTDEKARALFRVPSYWEPTYCGLH